MLFELSIIPLGRFSHISAEIAGALQLIEQSGLTYQLTPTATCIEGEWDEVMPLIRECHERLRRRSPHIVTFVKIEDQAGADDQLTHNVASVDQRAGHALSHSASY